MNKALIVFCLLLATANILPAQQSYTVQVGTFLDVRPQDFDPIRPFGFVYAKELDGNLHQVFVGGYTTEEAAQEVAGTLRQRGFDRATVQARDTRSGQQVTVIQIATRYLNKPIDWEKLQQAGPLYVLLEDERIKVLTGIFANIPAANEVLPDVQSLGYGDAFIKNVNSAELVQVNSFSTGLKEPLIPLNFTESAPPATQAPAPESRPIVPTAQPASMENTQERVVTTARTPTVPRPDNSPASTTPVNTSPTNIPQPASYGDTGTRIATSSPTTSAAASMPAIRGRVKRTSALELQRVLKSEGYYSSSLDGYYGPGTTSAYNEMIAQDPTIQKYQILAEYYRNPAASASGSRMQQAIDRIPSDPNALLVIEGSSEPMAVAYQAYQLFMAVGPNAQTNAKMNQAIRSAYEGKRLTQSPPFDYRATYAYQDLNQLVKHLFFVHAAPDVNYAVPCWVYNRHPAEAAQAQAAISGFTNHFSVQACDSFQSWPEVRLLQAVAFDITPTARDQQEMLAEAAGHRSALYLSTTPLNAQETAAVKSWNERLWSGLAGWATTDPMHGDAVKALKVTYYQTQVRLEDYYMDKGFEAAEASALALASLQALAGVPLNRFAR